jgi:hypothetical protein
MKLASQVNSDHQGDARIQRIVELGRWQNFTQVDWMMESSKNSRALSHSAGINERGLEPRNWRL